LIENSLYSLSRLVSTSLLVLVGLILFDVINRYLFSNGSIALQELEWHIFDFIMLFSLYYTLKVDGHVRVDIIYNSLSSRLKKYLDIATYLLFIIPFSLLVIIKSYGFVEMSYLQNEISSDPGGLQYRFIVKSFIILGFSLLVVQSILNIKNILKEKDS
jgi:TRAP-type mannitol/chloroaromatic compound transport system permease small subunit